MIAMTMATANIQLQAIVSTDYDFDFNEDINNTSSSFISFNYLKKEIDKYIVLTEKPEFSIINIKLIPLFSFAR